MIDDVVSAYVDGATETGYAEDWDLEQLWTGLKVALPGRARRARSCSTGVADGDQAALSAEALKEELLDDVHRAYDEREAQARLRGHARARAAGAALGARPQVARAPLRDGLPAGRHPPARDGQPRPGRGVPARGLRHVHRHARRHQGGVGRVPVQPRGEDPGGAGGRGPGQAGRGRRGRGAGRGPGGDGEGAGPPGGGGDGRGSPGRRQRRRGDGDRRGRPPRGRGGRRATHRAGALAAEPNRRAPGRSWRVKGLDAPKPQPTS